MKGCNHDFEKIIDESSIMWGLARDYKEYLVCKKCGIIIGE